MHAGVGLAEFVQPAGEAVDGGLVRDADGEVVEARGRAGPVRVEAQIMERTGALFAVAQQAAAVEPLIAGYWQEGREQSRHAQRVFWTRLAEDGLLPPGTDLTWLVDTASVIAAAETYLLVTRMLGWDLDTYQAWVAATWTRLLTSPGGISGVTGSRTGR